MPTISRSWPRAARNTRRPMRPKPLIPTRVAILSSFCPEPEGQSSPSAPERRSGARDPRRQQSVLACARRSAEISDVVATERRRRPDRRVAAMRDRWILALAALVLAFAVGFWMSTALRARPSLVSAPAKEAEPAAVAGIAQPVRIDRDRHGVPHVDAASEADAFFALGYCQAEDRLAQLLHLRRRARGTAAEEVGSAALEADQLARLLDFRGLADRQW